MKIILKVDKFRRLIINDQSGLDLESYVDGIGWVLDNDADVPDHVIRAHIEAAKGILEKVKI